MVPAQEDDTEAAKKVAEAYAKKRGLLLELREKAVGVELAPLRWSIDQKLRALTKSYIPQERGQREGEDLVRRYLAADAAEQAVERDKARERARKQKKKMAKLKMEAKKLKQEAEVRRAAKAKEKLEQKAAQEAAIAARQSAERVFRVNELQPKGAKGQAKKSQVARRDFLEHLRHRHGVSDKVQAYWGEFVV